VREESSAWYLPKLVGVGLTHVAGARHPLKRIGPPSGNSAIHRSIRVVSHRFIPMPTTPQHGISGARYVLDGTRPRECRSLSRWKKWLHAANRSVAVTVIEHRGTLVTVSSQFVGFDPAPCATGRPKLFVTRVYGGALGGTVWRSTTWNACLRHHMVAVREVMRTVARSRDRTRSRLPRPAADRRKRLS
jgi:hypothetical protein